MVENPGSISAGAGLYKAILAQLSASPLILDRVTLEDEETPAPDPRRSASRLAIEHHAVMVFWIEAEETYRIYFYIPDSPGGTLTSRAIDLDLSSQSGQFEVVAVVASGMIEGLLASRNLRMSSPKRVPPPPVSPVAEGDAKATHRRQFEIVAAYAGAVVATDMVSHGGTLGVGIFPVDRLSVAVSFTQNAPQRFSSDELRLKVISQQFEILAAGRMVVHPVDVRLGVSWSVDLRTLSTTARSEGIDARPDRFIGVHSLGAFLSAAWTYRGRIGVFGRVGANLALNETVYRIARTNGPTKVFEPFVGKLFYQLGVIVLL